MAEEKPVRSSLSRVADELEVGENRGFERIWAQMTNVAIAIMALFVTAALLGALGRGWLSRGHADGGSVAVDYDRIARFGAPTTLVVHVRCPAACASTSDDVTLHLGGAILHGLHIDRIEPRPRRWTGRGTGELDLDLTFATPVPSAGKAAEGLAVAVAAQTARIGFVTVEVGAAGEPPVPLHMLVLP
jgi:hypothetical protein